MSRQWTDDQRRAIATIDQNLLVSAAAGSGKTAVLAERCAYLVCDAPEPCDVDQLLVVTFTRLAATEMRSRIEQALRDRVTAAGEETDPRLLRQLTLIDRASIGTLHSFCTSVLREHFQLVGIDPAFTLVDEEQARLLRLETVRALFAERYDRDSAGDFERLIDDYGDGDDAALMQTVLATHDLLCSVIDRDAWLDEAVQRLEQAAKLPLARSELGRRLIAEVRRSVRALSDDCTRLADSLSRQSELSKYAQYAAELCETIHGWETVIAEGSFNAMADRVRSWTPPKLPATPSEVRGKDAAKEQIDAIRERMTGGYLGGICRFSETEWKDGVERTLAPTRTFLELVSEFFTRFQQAKSLQRWLDFADLERMTLVVLDGPSAVARAYHERFRHVLVDEYQDINEVQDKILSLVSRECVSGVGIRGNLFCVGDVKQSIYRFRLADPARFQARMAQFRREKSLGGTVIDLRTNFRSRALLLEALNGLFERLMSAEAMEIEYDKTHRLNAPADSPYHAHPANSVPVEIHVLPAIQRGATDADTEDDADHDRTQQEAAFIAAKIRELVADPAFKVLDKLGDQIVTRPARFGDVAILLRALQFKADAFAQVLRKAGIAVHSTSRTGFFESIEVRDMLALLAVLDNQRQDIPLAAVLRSPLLGLADPDDLLAKIRLSQPDPSVPFHVAALQYRDDRVQQVFARLRAWRDMANQRPLAEMVWNVYTSTGYLTFCGGLADGDQRVANLLELHKRAGQFARFARVGLGRFRQFLESLQDESDLGQPSVAVEGAETVRIMSVHGSKGLEFPIVFVPDLGKRHNLRSAQGAILVDRNAHVGMRAVDEALRVRYPSLSHVLASEAIRRQTLAEEMRVLYVAATRAREKLILLGTPSGKTAEQWAGRWTRHAGAIPPATVLAAAAQLDWIGPAATALAATSPELISVTIHTEPIAAPTVPGAATSELREKLARLEPLDPPAVLNDAALELLDRIQVPYAFSDFSSKPAARSVSNLAAAERRGHQRVQLAVPHAMESAEGLSATDIGNATHVLLEHVDFSARCSPESLRFLVERLVGGRFMSRAAAESIDLESVCWFAQSEVGVLLRRHAKCVRRELPLYFPIGTGPEPMDRVMVRGRMDVLIQLADRTIIIDYKTDRVRAEDLDRQVEHHRPQLRLYCDAIGTVTGKPVEAHLAFFFARECRRVQ